MSPRTLRLILAYGALAAVLLACLKVISLAPLALDWGRELGADVVARQLAGMESMKPLLFNRPLQGAVMFATVFLIGVAESAIGAWLVRRPPG